MSKNILVIKLSALGDFILAFGPMQAIREHHKDDKITLLTTKNFKAMAEKSGYFDEIIITKRTGITDIAEWLKIFKFFNQNKFSRVYDLQNQERTKIYYNLCIKKPEWSGVIKGNNLFYDNPNWKEMHAFKRHTEILKVAGIKETPLPDLSWMKADIERLFKLENIKKPYVLFMPGSSPQHKEKRWPAIKFGGLALKVIRDGYDVVLIGTKDDRDIIDQIINIASNVKDLSEKTSFYDIYALADEASGIVGNDTGPAHIAALANKPTISLFCSKKSSASKSAPVGKFVKCIEAEDMENISVKDIYDIFEPLK